MSDHLKWHQPIPLLKLVLDPRDAKSVDSGNVHFSVGNILWFENVLNRTCSTVYSSEKVFFCGGHVWNAKPSSYIFPAVFSCLCILYIYIPKSLQTSLLIESVLILISLANFRMLRAGFRLIHCKTFRLIETVREDRGRPGLCLSTMLPVSAKRDKVLETNILFVLSNDDIWLLLPALNNYFYDSWAPTFHHDIPLNQKVVWVKRIKI